MNTFQLREETLDDYRKDEGTNSHEDGTSLGWLICQLMMIRLTLVLKGI